MHHKYVLRDGASLWTGSTNWTDDSWRREENVIVTVESPQLVAPFAQDFEQLWTTRRRREERQGAAEPGPRRRPKTRAWFSPGYGEALAHRIAHAIGTGEDAHPDRVPRDHVRARSSARSRRSPPTARSTSPASST